MLESTVFAGSERPQRIEMKQPSRSMPSPGPFDGTATAQSGNAPVAFHLPHCRGLPGAFGPVFAIPHVVRAAL